MLSTARDLRLQPQTASYSSEEASSMGEDVFLTMGLTIPTA